VSILDRLWLRRMRRALSVERQDVRRKWNRSLPSGEYLDDRWERATRLGFGQGSSIYDSSVVIGDVRVGSNTWIGPFVLLDGSGGLRIGDNCSVSAGTQIYSHDTVAWALSAGLNPAVTASTAIGSNVYIGPNTVIAKGVQIGDGVVIGANSFVNIDVPAGCRAWGNPSRIRDEGACRHE
jgi:acetyltransferase-like isoleucine patch superfamily enzyme